MEYTLYLHTNNLIKDKQPRKFTQKNIKWFYVTQSNQNGYWYNYPYAVTSSKLRASYEHKNVFLTISM